MPPPPIVPLDKRGAVPHHASMAPRIVFYRVSPAPSGRPVVRVVARYPLPELLPWALAVEVAVARFEREHRVSRWQEAAEMVRVG